MKVEYVSNNLESRKYPDYFTSYKFDYEGCILFCSINLSTLLIPDLGPKDISIKFVFELKSCTEQVILHSHPYQ